MKELTIEEKARRFDEAIKKMKSKLKDFKEIIISRSDIEEIFPELKESKSEKIKKDIKQHFLHLDDTFPDKAKWIAWLEKQGDKDKLIQELSEYKVKYTQEVLEKQINSMSNKDDERLRKTTIAFLKDFAEQGYENAAECIDWLEKQGEYEYTLKSSNMLDVSKLTDRITKLAKDYELNLPNRSYDIYAFAQDILEWIEKQYKKELVNFDEAEKEKSDFVGGGFIKCFCNFLDFKKFKTYWLEYIGDDNYNVRSDNLLGKTYHITPYQLYTIFRKQTGLKKQGESVKTNPTEFDIKLQGAYQTPDEIIEECHQDNANHIIDIVTEQRKPAEWSKEDENKFKIVVTALVEDHEATPELINWFKSLKERVRSKQGEQTSLQTNESAWLYLVSDVLTWKDGIGQYLDDPRVQELAKKLRSEYAQKLYNSVQDAPNEQKPIEVKGKSALEAVREEKVDNSNKVEPKFHEGDKLISTRNPNLTYEILEVGHVNELGNLEYKVVIFANGKSDIKYLECKKVDEWAKLIEQNPTNEVESKFKVDDYVVRKDGKNFHDNRNFARITKI